MKYVRFLLALVLAFALALPASAMTGNSNEPAHYVSIGDSLAAGMIHDSSISKGFSGILAERLKEDELLASYNNDFGIPGATTTRILEALEKNIAPPLPTAKEDLNIESVIKRADVITISIGANDILSKVKFDPVSQKLEYDLLTVSATITETGKNVTQILQKIKALNPQADVFVMGLYNPFPTMVTEAFILNMMVDRVESEFKKAAEENDYYFVSVKEAMGKNSAEYLPNPANIHPSDAGYKAIADQFYGPVKEYIELVPLPEVIDPEPTPEPPIPVPTFKDVKPSHGSYEFIMQAAQKGILKGYENGTFRPNNTVKRVQVTSMLARMMKLTDTTKKVPYTDISKYEEETQREIALAYNAGLLKEGKKFGPSAAISRLEFAYMVDAAYSYTFGKVYYPEKTAPFTDIKKLSKEDQRVITVLYDFEIASGDKGKFNPQGKVTRAQAAKMLVQLNSKFE